jgi:hypothetical protein
LGVSAQVINKRRLEKPEARKASREQALREVRAPLRLRRRMRTMVSCAAVSTERSALCL